MSLKTGKPLVLLVKPPHLFWNKPLKTLDEAKLMIQLSSSVFSAKNNSQFKYPSLLSLLIMYTKHNIYLIIFKLLPIMVTPIMGIRVWTQGTSDLSDLCAVVATKTCFAARSHHFHNVAYNFMK